MSEILEIIMLISFGFSWPINLYKNIKSKSTKSISIWFYTLIFFGYVAGIASKFLNQEYMNNFSNKWYVLIFYFINLIVVGLNILVYFNNRKVENNEKLQTI